ncbi:DNA repair protein RecN [Patiriisocius marinus]|uniref:DNA repair protein RecN n=1 Tax=Patiriisocius marinus TaxID=1397112 RepID=A0A5J4J4Z6_9FLAO|nr:DNA repair protein RecN [Patiriisocius marinus]GER60861.1 DNA repair protein RecN [Patiriisocius marinus]
MITSLSIKNYALIEDIRVDLQQGLTIITGETGAGKSILLGAMALLLGKRADSSSVRNAEKKCIVEGEFNLNGYGLKNVFLENDLDYDNHTIIRREILPSGKSRAFVNDSPVGLSQLQTLAVFLVDIHSQNTTNSFADESFQVEVIDAVGGTLPLLTKYQNNLSLYSEISKKLVIAKEEKFSADKELDYNAFLQSELTEIPLKGIKQDALEETYETLNNAEEIQEALGSVLQIANLEDQGALDQLKQMRAILSRLSGFSSSFNELQERLNSVVLELEDVLESVQNKMESVEVDPSELTRIDDLLQHVYKLQQKHNVQTVEELIVIEEELSAKLYTTAVLDERIAQLENEQNTLLEVLKISAEALFKSRQKVLPKLISLLEDKLALLGLPNARFKIEHVVTEDFKKLGNDRVAVYFTANKGGTFGLLKKVASGGEMSRIMLSVKAVLATYKQLPTIIFDEIDTGVSGEIALKMAGIMSTMSENMQLISITHLPQIAAKGSNHIKVYKEDVNNITETKLMSLNEEERIVEIAQMIGGNSVTDTTLANAKELLN